MPVELKILGFLGITTPVEKIDYKIRYALYMVGKGKAI